MREIEIKVRVADKAKMLEKLNHASLELTAPVTQRDRVFGLPGADGGAGSAVPWLRIRTETKAGNVKQIFTLKKSITNQLDSIEHETEVENAEETASIIQHIGFTPYSDTTKTRQKAQIGDIELCVDSVEGLGDFIEAEKLTDEMADYDAVVAELWVVLERFDVAREDEVTDGYDVLMRREQGLKD